MSGYDSSENIKDFRTVLDITNHEVKALTFMNLGARATTITKMRERIMGLPDLDFQVSRENLSKYMKSLAAVGEGDIVTASFVAGKKHGKRAMGWSLTPKGEYLKPAVAFGMDFLPGRYGISACHVMGFMRSPAKRRGTHDKIDILRSLSSVGPQSPRQLSDVTGQRPTLTQYKLYDLGSVASGSELYPHGLPFVESMDGNMEAQGYIYQWTGKPFNADDFSARETEFVRLANVFTESDSGASFDASSLFRGSAYKKKSSLQNALSGLRKRGYVSRMLPKDFNRFDLTAEGLEYATGCLEPMLGYLNGDRDDFLYVLRNQPSVDGLVRAANVFNAYRSDAK